MHLIEKHIIKSKHTLYNECERICSLNKLVYNQTLYNIRQHFFNTKQYLNLNSNYHILKTQPAYKLLPTKVACQTIKIVDRQFKSFFALLNNKNHNNKTNIPRYKQNNDKCITIYPNQTINKTAFKNNIIHLSQSNIKFKTKITQFKSIKEIRIIPKNNHYVIEVVYSRLEKPTTPDNKKYCGIDLGLNNLATVGYNSKITPIIINGKPLKAINQFYNKKIAHLKSQLHTPQKSSNKIKNLTFKRNNKISDYLHKSSRLLVNHLVSNNITHVVVGLNKQWKQDINIGKINNQNFVQIPHTRFLEIISYKLKLEGITITQREESYSSKCSFLDNEPIKKHEKYAGRRIKRGLFKTNNGRIINADLNAAYNILKKEIPNAFEGIEGLGVNPKRLTPFK